MSQEAIFASCPSIFDGSTSPKGVLLPILINCGLNRNIHTTILALLESYKAEIATVELVKPSKEYNE